MIPGWRYRYQPEMKNIIREEYEKIYMKSMDKNALAPTERYTMKREALVSLTERVYNDMNEENLHRRWIAKKALRKCGQDPFQDKIIPLKKLNGHLDELNKVSAYKIMQTSKHVMDL